MLSTNAINFVAETPSVFLLPHKLTGTIGAGLSGTLYVNIAIDGEAVSNVTDFSIGSANNSGEIFVTPAKASTLGVGRHTSIITVTACLDDPTCKTGELPVCS